MKEAIRYTIQIAIFNSIFKPTSFNREKKLSKVYSRHKFDTIQKAFFGRSSSIKWKNACGARCMKANY